MHVHLFLIETFRFIGHHSIKTLGITLPKVTRLMAAAQYGSVDGATLVDLGGVDVAVERCIN